ncbi:hypothetical protein [Thalassotalea sediminis]|uniref:hypothetical protein n=1 Tax=Thalassotalea sediminis TaxID=1759089 RepID=UPI0025745052|nr:hypothetical protein [Thalassotalea sediminis]
MTRYIDTPHQYGDLALVQQAIQTCQEEIEQCLSTQYQLVNTSLSVDFTELLDIRLNALSILNHIMMEQSPKIRQDFKGACSVSADDYKVKDENNAKPAQAITQMLESTKQTIELLNNIRRYTKDTLIKDNLAGISNQLSLSYQQLKQCKQSLKHKEVSKT